MDQYQVLTAKPYTKDVLKHMQKRIHHFQSEQSITKKISKIMQEVLDIVFSQQVLKQTTFIDQISIQNYALWQKVFSNSKNTPNLIFLSQEEIAQQLFTLYHLQQDTYIHRLLFTSAYREKALDCFNNIACAFSLEQHAGTFLFWGVSKTSPQRIKLFPKGNKLISTDNSYSLDITPEAIHEALENGDIIPSVLLTFLLLAFYYGLFLGGGLRQPLYLSQIKQGNIQLLSSLGESEEAAYVKNIPSTETVFPRNAFAFLKGSNHTNIPATGLDLLLYKNDTSWEKIMNATKQIPYRELFYRIYPELYQQLCTHENKKSELLAITQQDIDELIGFYKKIPAWVTLGDAS
jgi:hypothetical protein